MSALYPPDVIGAGSRLMALVQSLDQRPLPPKGIATPINGTKRFDRDSWVGPNGETWDDLLTHEQQALDPDFEPPSGHISDQPDFPGYAENH